VTRKRRLVPLPRKPSVLHILQAYEKQVRLALAYLRQCVKGVVGVD
jgi:hypothetical protein